MIKQMKPFKKSIFWGLTIITCSIGLWGSSQIESVEATRTVSTHLGTFEGSTTFTASSSNGINPGLLMEVMDKDGNLTQYESEEGIITIPNTQEGAYVTRAKLLGKTKYLDEETGEVSDTWEDGRNLKLVSVENPILLTRGKNLFDEQVENNQDVNINTGIVTDGSRTISVNFIPVEPNTTYTLTRPIAKRNVGIRYYSGNQTFISTQPFINHDGKFSVTFTTPSNCQFIKFIDEANTLEKGYQLEQGSIATSYEPYQSGTLTLDDELVLRGIGKIQDTLDLITGIVIERIDEMVLDGSEDWGVNETYKFFGLSHPIDNYVGGEENLCLNNKLPLGQVYANDDSLTHTVKALFLSDAKYLRIRTPEIMNGQTLDEFKRWLSDEPITVQYQFATPFTKRIKMMSDYLFKPANVEYVELIGTIHPTIVSVTLPTNLLTFTIDPNQKTGQQFIASEFTLTNETLAPLQVELKTFEQTSDVLNDVLPNTHDNWSVLNKNQSKDIALALVPKEGEGWLSLHEGPRYVADTSNGFIGTVRGKSTVGFAFDALHGQAFSEALNPQYRLVFMFGFSQ